MSAHHAESSHGIGQYIVVWAVLLVLLFVSIALGHIQNHVVMNATVFGVAGVKALLVVLFFMHIRLEPWVVVALIVIALLFMAALLLGVMPDVTMNPTAGPTPL